MTTGLSQPSRPSTASQQQSGGGGFTRDQLDSLSLAALRSRAKTIQESLGPSAQRPPSHQAGLVDWVLAHQSRGPLLTGTRSSPNLATTDGLPVLPFTPPRREPRSDAGGGYSTTSNVSSVADFLESHSMRSSWGDARSEPRGRAMSGADFADRAQTVIIFDWDDTLFPTCLVKGVLRLDPRLPMDQQGPLAERLPADELVRLQLCERHAVALLRASQSRGHVVVVTLATRPWVTIACKYFYPSMGQALSSLNIPIIYSQEGITEAQRRESQGLTSMSEAERFWGLVKGRAISEEVQRFYSQYPGQTWKNIISIGDSRFERYGLLAATSSYMRGREICDDASEPYTPGERAPWQSAGGKRLRVKCCKLMDQPDGRELAAQLNILARWIGPMVDLDEGFDLDLQDITDERQVSVIEAVLRGRRPVTDLPRP